MPLYMDRHDLDETVNAEHVAKIHQEDLKIEHKFGCKGLTYWFDDQRKTAFCLINAPNKSALRAMHDKAHGAIPHSIIEVDPDVVESFLGRIEDPEKDVNQELNIINDSAFRVLLVVEVLASRLDLLNLSDYRNKLKGFCRNVKESVQRHNGRLVRDHLYGSLCSFRSIEEADECSLEIQSLFTGIKIPEEVMQLKLGLGSGVPIESGKGIFEETIKLAERLSRVVSGPIVVSSNIRELYAHQDFGLQRHNGSVRFLSPSDERFLNSFMDFLDESWNRTNLKVNDFCSVLGLSKSQLYRKIKSISGKSLNTFLREFRMQRALKMLEHHKGNISEIAFDTGFNSPAYFSKCFYQMYGTLPSIYVKEI